MDRVTAIKIKQDDGTYSAEIPISVAANLVQWDQNYNLIDILGNVDIDQTGNIQSQINKKVDSTQLSNYVANQLNLDVTNWLDENVNPVGSAVVVDSSLTVSGAAADAKVTGDEISDLKNATDDIRYGDICMTGDLEQSGEVTIVPDLINNSVVTATGEIGNASAKRVTNKTLLYIPDGAMFETNVTTEIYNPKPFCFDAQGVFLGIAETANTMINGTRYVRFSLARKDDGNLTPEQAKTYFTFKLKKTTLKYIVEAVTEKGKNIVYATNWEETSADISFSGEDVVLTAVGSGTYRTAATNIDVSNVNDITISLGSRTTGSGMNVAGIRYGFVTNGTISWQGYLSIFPATIDVSNVDTLRIGLYVATSSVTDGTSVTYTKLQIEKGSSETPFVKGDMTAIDSTLRSYLPMIQSLYSDKSLTSIPNTVVRSIAHRGDDIVAPQCTAPSYILARKEGFTIAENDLNISEDGEYVMWHDSNFNRLGNLVDIEGYAMYTDGTDYYWVKNGSVYTYDFTNEEYVASTVPLSSLTRCAGKDYNVKTVTGATGLNFNLLRRIDFGAYKGSQFAGTQILTFDEWVLLCKQLGMEIYVDKKIEWTDAQLTESAQIVKKYGMGDYASWLSLNVRQINLIRETIPGVRVGTLQHPNAEAIAMFSDVNTGRGIFFDGDAKNGLTASAVQLGLDAGFEVETYYVDFGSTTEEAVLSKIREAVSYGVTGITIDHYTVTNAYEYLFDLYQLIKITH